MADLREGGRKTTVNQGLTGLEVSLLRRVQQRGGGGRLHNHPVICRIANDDLQTLFNGRDALTAIKALAAMFHDASRRATATGCGLIDEAGVDGIANAVDHRA